MGSKTALVTGASSGIGYQIAKDLIANGWQVSVVSRNATKIDLKDAFAINCDLADEQSCDKVLNLHQVHWGKRLDLLVNAAGIATKSSILEQTASGWDAEFNVNVRGMFLLCRDFLPLIKESKGLIVNIASISGFEGSKSMPAYSASKHAVIGLTRSITKELVDTGARATAICPGYVATPMTNDVQDAGIVSSKEMIQPSDISKIVSMLLRLSPHAHLPEVEIRRI